MNVVIKRWWKTIHSAVPPSLRLQTSEGGRGPREQPPKMTLGEKELEVTFPAQQRLSLKQDVQSSFPEKGGGAWF